MTSDITEIGDGRGDGVIDVLLVQHHRQLRTQ